MFGFNAGNRVLSECPAKDFGVRSTIRDSENLLEPFMKFRDAGKQNSNEKGIVFTHTLMCIGKEV